MDKGGINKFGYLWDVIKSLVLPTSVVVALLAFNNDGGHNNVFLIAGCIALFIEIIAVVYISSKRSKSSEEQKKIRTLRLNMLRMLLKVNLMLPKFC